MTQVLDWLRRYQDRGHRMGFYPEAGDGQWGPDSEKMMNVVFELAEKSLGLKPPAPPVYPNLPPRYAWVAQLSPMPLIVHEVLKLLGTVEVAGAASSPIIMGWRDELKAAGVPVGGYTDDSVPWCGLLAAIVALRAQKDLEPVDNVLWARDWLKFGVPVSTPMLGDYAVWPRGSGGHVAIVLAEDRQGFLHIAGGNQQDAVNIMRKLKKDALGFRRARYTNQPATIRRYIVDAAGQVSRNER